MAKMGGEEQSVVKTQVAEQKAEPQKTTVDVDAILKRLDRLEQENDELRKGKMSVFKAGREIYDGPRTYSYKMWGGVPVLAYKSFKKDPTKELVFKDQFGQRKSNHYLKLTLANDKEVEVEVNEFNRDYTSSEKLEAESRTDNKGNLLGFAFDTEEYGEIIVEANIIN